MPDFGSLGDEYQANYEATEFLLLYMDNKAYLPNMVTFVDLPSLTGPWWCICLWPFCYCVVCGGEFPVEVKEPF